MAIVPLGDQAIFVEYAQKLDLEVNAAAQQLAMRIRARAPHWLQDIVPTLGGVALYPDFSDPALPPAPLQAVQALVDECLGETATAADAGEDRLIDIPVCYEPEFGLDLEPLAAQLHIDTAELVRRHSSARYRVLMMGFVPGHAYLGGLDPSLTVPRRTSPRARVPAGSVAIANGQTVIYPFETPGGWHVVGCTPLRAFDPDRDPPCVFAPRDAVRFVPISAAQFREMQRAAGAPKSRPKAGA